MAVRSRWREGVSVALSAGLIALTVSSAPTFAQSVDADPSRAAPSAAPSAGASATPTPPADPAADQARAEFEAGLAALRDERYADALGAFERSYRVRRVASVALNLGITLRALGRLVEARQRFQEFLELASPAQHERYDREVTGYLADLGRRIVRLRVTLEPEAARLTVDGRRAVQGPDGNYTVDPGDRVFEAQLEGYESARESRSLASGASSELRFVLRRSAQTPDPRATVPGPVSGEVPITSRPAFWAGIAGGVAVVAIVSGVLIGLAVAPTPAPAGTNTGRTFMTIGFSY